MREEARAIIKRVCNANEDHALIFTGTGATSAVNLLVSKLKLKQIVDTIKLKQFVTASLENPEDKTVLLAHLSSGGQGQQTSNDSSSAAASITSEHFCKKNRWNSYDCTLCKVILPSLGAYEKHAQTEFHLRRMEVEVTKKQMNSAYEAFPLVFVSIYEHNSNLLPWRETGSRIELIPMSDNGDFDYAFLERKLRHYRDQNCVKVGAFSAGSNITGTLFDVDRIAYICHSNNTLAFLDYAAVSPYQEINMAGPG